MRKLRSQRWTEATYHDLNIHLMVEGLVQHSERGPSGITCIDQGQVKI